MEILGSVDELVIHSIMAQMLVNPRDVMNMGLVCRRWYAIARMLLLGTPQASRVGCLTDAYRLGWPCVIAHQLSLPCNSATAMFPGMEILGACIGKNRRRLRYICSAETRSVEAFVMGSNERLGRDSPVLMLSHWLTRAIASLVSNNATTTV